MMICLLDAANSSVPQQFSPLRRTNRNMIRMDNKNSGKVWSDLRSRRRMQKNKTRRGQWTTTGHLPFNLRFSGSSGGFFRHTNTCELRNMTCGVSILKVIKENQKKRILMPPLFKGRTHFGKNKGRDLLSCCWWLTDGDGFWIAVGRSSVLCWEVICCLVIVVVTFEESYLRKFLTKLLTIWEFADWYEMGGRTEGRWQWMGWDEIGYWESYRNGVYGDE